MSGYEVARRIRKEPWGKKMRLMAALPAVLNGSPPPPL
jgi:hypothetical protein